MLFINKANKPIVIFLVILTTFVTVLLGFVHLYIPFIVIGGISAMYLFYNPKQLIYVLCFLMFTNGYIRMQLNQFTGVSLFIDLLIMTLYIKLLFDCLFQKKLNLILQAPMLSSIVIFSLYCLLRLFPAGIEFSARIHSLRGVLYYIFLYFVGYFYYFDKQEFKRFCLFYAFMLLLLCVYALSQQFLGFSARELDWVRYLESNRHTSMYTSEEIRVFSLQCTALDFACLLGLFIPAGIPYILSLPSKYHLHGLLELIFIAFISTLTFIRMAMVSWLIASLIICILLWHLKYFNPNNFGKILVAIFSFLLVVVLGFSTLSFSTGKNLDVLLNRVKSIGALTSFNSISQQSTRGRNEINSMYHRISIWQNRIVSTKNPFLGDGLGVLKTTAYSTSGLGQREDVTDNTYISIYCEIGVIGLLLFLNMIFGWLMFYFKQLKRSPLLCLMPIGMIVSFLIMMAGNEASIQTPIRLNIWLLLGMFCRKIKENDILPSTFN